MTDPHRDAAPTPAHRSREDAPPTDAVPGDGPPADAPPRDAPPRDAPPTDAPPTDAPPTDGDRAWVRWAVQACIEVARRRGPRYARRLREQHDPGDAMADLLVLAARRVAPLPERRLRALPRERLAVEGRAWMALDRADRRVLRRWAEVETTGSTTAASTTAASTTAASTTAASRMGAAPEVSAFPGRPPSAGPGGVAAPQPLSVAEVEHATDALLRWAEARNGLRGTAP